MAGRLVVIDISSSDEEDNGTTHKGDEKKTVVRSKEEKAREDDECCILAFDPFDSLTTKFNKKFKLENPLKFERGAEEEIVILAERGKVACKDYPHSRHHCVEYPFDKTPHESCCAKCYCFVCDEVAPCMFWNAKSAGHCHATDEQNWKDLRLSTKINKQINKQNLPNKGKIIRSLPRVEVVRCALLCNVSEARVKKR